MFKNVRKEEIVIPAQMHYLKDVREFIEQIGHRYRFSDKITNSFKLVVDEACTNIIRHGYRDIKNGKITVRAIIRRMSLTMVIIDQGRSFDPRQVKDPDLDKYVRIGKKGGLGIFMMRKLMDDIKYNVTAYGNELRLTKVRETMEMPKYLVLWDSLTLRTKFSLVVSAVLTILAIIVFFVSNARIQDNVFKEVFNQASVISRNLADISWDPLVQEQDLKLFEAAKSAKESNPVVIEKVAITDSAYRIVAMYPIEFELRNQQIPLANSQFMDSLNSSAIYKFSAGDSIDYLFVSPIQLVNVDRAPIGYAVVSVDNDTIFEKMVNTRQRLILYLVIFLIFSYVGTFFLITIIMKPFHKLADWVRQVGRGHVDEDELDIDSRDELGEIAQAFSEMTSKFREAQHSIIEQQRLQKELQVAQEIQQMLLPDDFPDVVGYDIASYYQAAKEVGGDLFDFVEVDENSIGICVADVSGKGVPGSLVMTMIRTSLRLEARGAKNPAEVLSRVNRFVTADMRKGMFVTMFYVILDSRERVVSFASAGHNPMILYRGKNKETYYLNPSGFPVGITLPDINLFSEKIQADKIKLHPDDILVLYTDGITEAMNQKRELYGEERFLAAIRKYGHLDVAEFVKHLKDDILEFTGGYEQNDDITLVAIKENMAAVDVKVNMFKEILETLESDNKQTVKKITKEFGISPSTFYRYKRVYQEGGYDALREMFHGYTEVGTKHLSIEVKTKMYDIIREHPEWGAKKISDELKTEKYGFTVVSQNKIYDELKRAKLNKKELRINFVKKGGKRRLKPPGTPLLTLDGEVMVGYRTEEKKDMPFGFYPTPSPDKKAKEKIMVVKSKPEEEKSSSLKAEEVAETETEKKVPENTVDSGENAENKDVVVTEENQKKDKT